MKVSVAKYEGTETLKVTTKTAELELTDIRSFNSGVTFKWYLGSRLVDTTTWIDASKITNTYTGLMPLTVYKATVKAFNSNGELLASATCNISTPNEDAATPEAYLTADATIAKATVTLTGLAVDPNYIRHVEWMYKKKTDAVYKHGVVFVVTGGKSVYSIGPLTPDTVYEFKVTVENVTNSPRTTLFTKTIEVKTDSDVPQPEPETKKVNPPAPHFSSVKQRFRSGNDNKVYAKAYVYCDGNIAGVSHKLSYKVNGLGDWIPVDSDKWKQDGIDGVGEAEVTLNNNATSCTIRFKYMTYDALNYNPNDDTTFKETFSDSITLVKHFQWTTPKVQGNPIVITAEEWNRLIAYTELVGEALNHGVDVDEVAQGELISATAFNALKSAICRVIEQDNDMIKKPGDAIKASDIDSLRTGINSAEGE